MHFSKSRTVDFDKE